jgi:Skp family chaperone for outer membrane proteins
MTSSRLLAALALTAFVGVTACSSEPEPDAAPADAGAAEAPPQGMNPEMMALMQEAQEIQQELAPIQNEAMQDEALARQLADLQERIETAMRAESPELFTQMEALEAEFMAAQEAGDQELAQETAMKAQGVQMELQALHRSVLERPEIQGPIDSFEEAQRERMIAIDPEAGALMDRLDEIIAELQGP